MKLKQTIQKTGLPSRSCTIYINFLMITFGENKDSDPDLS